MPLRTSPTGFAECGMPKRLDYNKSPHRKEEPLFTISPFLYIIAQPRNMTNENQLCKETRHAPGRTMQMEKKYGRLTI